MKTKWLIIDRIDNDLFVQVCQNSVSMSEAASRLGLHFNSFKKRATELGCYRPNQSGKGLNKKMPFIPLSEIIYEGKHPQYQSYKLKKRLMTEKLKNHKCERCGIIEWMNKPISLELDHIDGNKHNHLLSNLRLLCPNCHSQTETYRSKNRKN
jgi:hypothetical protein